MPQPPLVRPDRNAEAPPPSGFGKRTWVAVPRSGEQQLSTLTRLSIVGFVWIAAWLVKSLRSAYVDPRPSIQASTVLWFAFAAALIGLFHSVRGPDVQGRARLVWDGLTLAFASLWIAAAFDAAFQATLSR